MWLAKVQKLNNRLIDTHWVVVASDDKVLVLPSSHSALVQWVDHAHVSFLLKAKQAALMELHAIAAIRADPNNRPDHQSYLTHDKTAQGEPSTLH